MVSSGLLLVIVTWTSQACPSWCLWLFTYASQGIRRSPVVVRSAATRLPSMILLATALSPKYLIQFFQTSGDCGFGPLWALLQVFASLLRCWWFFHSGSWISDQLDLLTRPGHHHPWEHHPMGDILPRHWKGGSMHCLLVAASSAMGLLHQSWKDPCPGPSFSVFQRQEVWLQVYGPDVQQSRSHNRSLKVVVQVWPCLNQLGNVHLETSWALWFAILSLTPRFQDLARTTRGQACEHIFVGTSIPEPFSSTQAEANRDACTRIPKDPGGLYTMPAWSKQSAWGHLWYTYQTKSPCVPLPDGRRCGVFLIWKLGFDLYLTLPTMSWLPPHQQDRAFQTCLLRVLRQLYLWPSNVCYRSDLSSAQAQ